MTEVAKQVLRLPVSVGATNHPPTPLSEIVQDPAFSTAVGLVKWGMESERTDGGNRYKGRASQKGKAFFGAIGSPIKKIFKSFIP
jgi:cell division ATPase FtsA